MTTATAPNATTGQVLAATLRKNFGIGTRTRRYGRLFGHHTDLHDAMIETIENAVQYPGYYSPEKTDILRTAWGAAMSYRKHGAKDGSWPPVDCEGAGQWPAPQRSPGSTEEA